MSITRPLRFLNLPLQGVVICVALAAEFNKSASADAPPSQVDPPTKQTCASLALEEQYETVRVGNLALASDTVLGGPPECVASVATDSPNVRVTLEKKGRFASVRIWALHDGFANVTVTGASGEDIGVIRVSVYPRDPRAHKGGK